MIFLKRFLKIAIWIFIGSCLWVMAAFFGSNYTIEIFVQETRRSSFEKLNLFGSLGKIFNTEQELLVKSSWWSISKTCRIYLCLDRQRPGTPNWFSAVFGPFAKFGHYKHCRCAESSHNLNCKDYSVVHVNFLSSKKENRRFDIEAKSQYRRNNFDNIAWW